MKKLLPIAVIAVMGLLSFASCSKKSTTTCTCKAVGSNGQDTTASFTKADAGYVSLAAECDSFNEYVSLSGSSYGCHL